RLAKEPSPYLRQHAENPVDWYPWGPEALERARKEDKPILLSIGYSACHWCHVMAHESFENPALAAVMNQHFINVKVDREERPDIDQLYQGVVQLMGKGGGWPLTIFMTPKREPFYGGTYFPPAPRHGLPAFGSLLEGIGEAWVKERAELEHQASIFKEGLTEFAAYGLEAKGSAWTKEDLASAATKLSSVVDRVHGGFGKSGPKFPNPMNLAFLLRGWRRTGDEAMKNGALLTLEKMALGGVHDQLGGGFHRYSVDERWLVPHFEKMLYDTAQLIHLYAEAQQIEPRPLWRETVERAVDWVQREMTAGGGGFFSAQDADSEGEEGRFFVWTPEEIDALLPPEDAALLKRVYGVTEEGNFEHGATVLEVKDPSTDPRFERARRVLFEARKKRIAPGLDDKILAGWNGLMIRGLAFASRVFDRPEWAQLAKRSADFVLEQMRREDGALDRSYGTSLPGVLEDYGDLAAGLLALAQATHEAKYVKAALELVDEATDRFWDEEKKAWLASANELLVPTYALHDNAFPSGASTITEAQLVLGAMTGQANYLDHAEAYLERMKDELLRNPLGFGHLLLCADTMLDGAAEVSLVGTQEETRAWRKVIDALYLPTVSVLRRVQGEPVPEVMQEVLGSREQTGAYLCQ
ncbi:MAG TPA: thioredoxin domain-containing protein, partial [Archangium sp.]